MLIHTIPTYEAREAFERCDLADVLFGLNDACVKWDNKTLECELPFIKAAGKEIRLFHWAAAETARLALVWCRTPAFDRSGPAAPTYEWSRLEMLIGLAADLLMDGRLLGTDAGRAGLVGDDISDVVQRIFTPQQLVQRQSIFRAAQALFMYRDAPIRRHARDPNFRTDLHEAAMRRVLGCDIEGFVLATLQAQGRSQGGHPLLTATQLIPIDNRAYDGSALLGQAPSGVIAPAANAVLDAQSASPTDMKQWMNDSWSRVNHGPQDWDRAMLEAPNPLLRFPMVRVFRDKPDHCIAPVPHLLNEWLYEPLAAYLHASFKPDERQRLDSLFEEYVGMVADICAPDGKPWLHESEIMPPVGKKVVDWARAFKDVVVLIEAKKAFIGLAERYQSNRSDWQTVFEKNWAKAVMQATDFWESVKQDKVPRLSGDRHKRALVVVVTWSETDFRAGFQDVHSSAIEPHLKLSDDVSHIPYIIISIDRLERVMATWEENDAEWLPRILEEAAAGSSSEVLRHLAPAGKGRLSEASEKLISDLRSHAGAAPTGTPS